MNKIMKYIIMIMTNIINSDNGYDNESESYKEDIKNDYIEKDMKKKKRETNEYKKISNIESNDDEKYDREEKYDTEKKKRYFSR